MIKNHCVSLNIKTLKPHSSGRRYLNAFDLMHKTGVWTTSDIDFCNAKKSELLKLPEAKIKLLYSSLLANINKIVSTYLNNTKSYDKFLFYDKKEKITSSLLKNIKKEVLNFKIISNFDGINKSKAVVLPYIKERHIISNANKKFLQYNSTDSIFIHPRKFMNNIVKGNLDNNGEKTQKYALMLPKTSLIKLINQKNKILEKFLLYFHKSKETYDFVFTKDDINKLENLAIKYDAINSLLEQNGIYTAGIETLLYSDLNKYLSNGDILPNKDILINFSSVYDKKQKTDISTITTFANTDRGVRFKTYWYDKEIINLIPDFRKQYNYFARNGNISAINALNKKITDYIENSEIAEVFLENLEPEAIKSKAQESGDFSLKQIETFFCNDETYYYIKNLKNYNVKRFYNVAMPLINCLKQYAGVNNITKGYLEALAFNNVKHSPAALYLRAGCTPISVSPEELADKIQKNKKLDYKQNIWFLYEM